MNIEFEKLLKNIINKYITRYENTNFFIEHSYNLEKSSQFGGSIMDNIREHLIPPTTPSIKGLIHYTDIRQFDISKNRTYIEDVSKNLSHIKINKTDNIFKNFLNKLYKCSDKSRNCYTLSSSDYAFYSIYSHIRYLVYVLKYVFHYITQSELMEKIQLIIPIKQMNNDY